MERLGGGNRRAVGDVGRSGTGVEDSELPRLAGAHGKWRQAERRQRGDGPLHR